MQEGGPTVFMPVTLLIFFILVQGDSLDYIELCHVTGYYTSSRYDEVSSHLQVLSASFTQEPQSFQLVRPFVASQAAN